MDIGKSIGLEYGLPTRTAFGQALLELGAENPNIVVLDGDLNDSTRTEYFAEKFPDRFFNVGIAESNLIGMASGLAAAGKEPLAASFACFLLCNAYDQIRMGIAFPHANVNLVGSHGGISIGEDGPSQMAIEDFALAGSLPGFVVLVPADEPSARAATRAMFAYRGPVYMRTGRPEVPIVYGDGAEVQIGKANQLREGDDCTIIACGLMVAVALEAAQHLAGRGRSARVLDMHTIKPVDEEAVRRAIQETKGIVTAEEHLLEGGLGAAVAQVVARVGPAPMEFVGIRNTYAESGAPQELLQTYGLMPHDVEEAVERVLARG
jgi:transketolase